MQKRISFRLKLFLTLSVIFAVFTILVLYFQFEREKNFRKSQLELTLDNVAVMTHNFILNNQLADSGNFVSIDSLVEIIPDLNIRVTVIDPSGVVVYDSEVGDVDSMENHLERPEIRSSVVSGSGASIRRSATTGNEYYYYSRFYSDYFVRTAALYDVRIENFLHIEKLFIFYLVLLFVIVSIILMFISTRFSDTVTKLRDFAIRVRSGEEIPETVQFPKDELGTISRQITAIYKELIETRKGLEMEKVKLSSHLDAIDEGIAFFSPGKQKLFTNKYFIQNLNMVSDISTISPDKIFELDEMKPLVAFIDEKLKSSTAIDPDNLPMQEIELQKGKRYFNVKCVIFQDLSFEIVISDKTKLEKRRIMKQQMTANIAHELKTPVATVMGYLETLQANNLTPEKKLYFIEKATRQAKRLADLVEDISTLNQIEETNEKYEFKEVNLAKIVDEVQENLKDRLDANKVSVHIEFPGKMIINGNKSLLYSVFYNLFDNVIKYGGEEIEINLSNYLEDNKNYYFSFANTGNEIEKQHLNRIFERFYRVDDGRSRKTGGTGLGLAIVKNAIHLHKGDISARQYKKKGVEFLFSLGK